MKKRLLVTAAMALALGAGAVAQDANPAQPDGPSQGQGGPRGGRGWGGGMMGGRGVIGTVTEVANDHYTIKSEAGEIYTVHFSANTRVMKQAPRQQGTRTESGERTPPQAIKPTDIKVGDAIAANGEIDAGAKSVGAVMVMQIDPERAKQMREMQANYAKTWLMGKVTAVNDTKVTLQSGVDNAAHTFVADENTTFRKRRDPITLAEVQVGDMVRVEGALKEGVFMATSVAVMGPQPTGGPQPAHGNPPR